MGMLLVSMYHHTRQLEMVSTLHQEAPSIGIFDTIPIFAFSRLSFWAAVLTVFMILPSIFIYQTAEENILFALPSIVGIGLAMLVFFLPLYSLNKRLVNEKSAKLGQVRQRIRDSIHELNQGVDRGDLTYIEAQNSQLAALVLEQEYIEKLRTWPWPRGTFTRLLGLIALPVLLFILQLLIQRFFPP
jgi:ABC-type transport system involved in cytochrome bd biosynthesis fused ATPase/permease subunit